MNTNSVSVEKTIDTIAYNLKGEFPEIEFAIIAYNGIDNFDQALATQQGAVLINPAGSKLIEEIENTSKGRLGKIHFAGISHEEEKIIFGLQTRHYYLAGFLVDLSQFKDSHTLLIELYSAAWKALKLKKDIIDENKKYYKFENTVFLPKITPLLEARQNMLGDAFAAFTLELTGQKGAILELAKLRCNMSLKRTPFYDPLQHPYPIALDATQLVYDDLKNTIAPKSSTIVKAYEMTVELDYTCSSNIILQWQTFISSAEKMAWASSDIKHILGAAIYTCEDTYNRSTAYLISEILDIEPLPLTHFVGYNPFSDIELQKRAHIKAAEKHFRKAVESIPNQDGGNIFYEAAFAQCKQLLQGNPIGWASPILLEAGDLYETQKNEEDIDGVKETIAKMFNEAEEIEKWRHIRQLHDGLIEYRKRGKQLELGLIMELLRQEPETREIAVQIKKLKDYMQNKHQ